MKIDKDFIIYMCLVLIGALCISILMYSIEQNNNYPQQTTHSPQLPCTLKKVEVNLQKIKYEI